MAGLLDNIKVDKLFKALFNRARTSAAKEYYEETIPTAFDVHATEIYLNPIPTTPPTVNTSIVSIHTGLVLTQDRSVANNKAWVVLPTWSANWSSGSGDVSQIMKNFISPKYGSGYAVKVYKGNGTQISELDNVNWMFDYKAGVLTFENDPGMNGSVVEQSIRIDVYQYIGQTVDAASTNAALAQLTDVDVATQPAVNGNVLIYDESLEKWRPFMLASGPVIMESKDIVNAGTQSVSLSKPYSMGNGALWVFLNGQLARQGSTHDYVEVDPYTVRFNFALEVGDVVTFRADNHDYSNFNVTPPPTTPPPTTEGDSTTTDPTVEPGEVMWELKFMLDTNQNKIDFTSIEGYDPAVHGMSLEDFYGQALDGQNRAITVEHFYSTTASNPTWDSVPADAVGQPVPLNGFDTFAAPSDNGWFEPELDFNRLGFETWSISKNFYKITKRGV